MRNCIPNNECKNVTEERCFKCRTYHGKYGMKEPRKKCPRCGAKLVNLPEPYVSIILEDVEDAKLPLLCCPECKWEWHCGILTPIKLSEFNNSIDKLCGIVVN